jgi:formylglycine-generating enzyme required for sulfatase activity
VIGFSGCRKESTTKVNKIDGAEMVLIPAGEFLMGTSEEELAAWLKAHPDATREWFSHEMPQHKVYLDAYYMYKHPVTVAQYRMFCEATGRAMPLAPVWKWQDTHPIVYVTWDDAQAYAAWAGASLPTEAQWEKAARGTDGRIYPWGNEWDASKAQCSKERLGDAGRTAPVGSFPAGASPYGALDMAGNVWEWCADWYGREYYTNAPARNPPGPTEAQATLLDLPVIKDGRLVWEKGKPRVLRGGSWSDTNPVNFRAANRFFYNPTNRNYNYGFRCVLRSPGP